MYGRIVSQALRYAYVCVCVCFISLIQQYMLNKYKQCRPSAYIYTNERAHVHKHIRNMKPDEAINWQQQQQQQQLRQQKLQEQGTTAKTALTEQNVNENVYSAVCCACVCACVWIWLASEREWFRIKAAYCLVG